MLRWLGWALAFAFVVVGLAAPGALANHGTGSCHSEALGEGFYVHRPSPGVVEVWQESNAVPGLQTHPCTDDAGARPADTRLYQHTGLDQEAVCSAIEDGAVCSAADRIDDAKALVTDTTGAAGPLASSAGASAGTFAGAVAENAGTAVDRPPPDVAAFATSVGDAASAFSQTGGASAGRIGAAAGGLTGSTGGDAGAVKDSVSEPARDLAVGIATDPARPGGPLQRFARDVGEGDTPAPAPGDVSAFAGAVGTEVGSLAAASGGSAEAVGTQAAASVAGWSPGEEDWIDGMSGAAGAFSDDLQDAWTQFFAGLQ